MKILQPLIGNYERFFDADQALEWKFLNVQKTLAIHTWTRTEALKTPKEIADFKEIMMNEVSVAIRGFENRKK